MKTIEENNRLIAEFMGLTLEPWQGEDRLGDDDTDTEYWFDEHGNVIDALLYHESWDWLMPVVEKIEILGSSEIMSRTLYSRFDITHNQITLKWSKNNGYQLKLEAYPEWMITHKSSISKEFIRVNLPSNSTKIEALYQAVVAFIEWYNKNQVEDGND